MESDGLSVQASIEKGIGCSRIEGYNGRWFKSKARMEEGGWMVKK